MRILREVSNVTNQDAKIWTQTVQQMSQLTNPDSPDLPLAVRVKLLLLKKVN
jgi:hypothetical protein